MKVNRSVWPVYAMIFGGIWTHCFPVVVLGVVLGFLWLTLTIFDGEVP